VCQGLDPKRPSGIFPYIRKKNGVDYRAKLKVSRLSQLRIYFISMEKICFSNFCAYITHLSMILKSNNFPF